MAVGKLDLIGDLAILQGSTYSLPIQFYDDEDEEVPSDFTGYAWRMQIRNRKSSTDYLLQLISDDGDIDITNQATGLIVVNISASVTEALNFDEGVYDLECINGSTVDRKLEGDVELNKEVTR